MRPSRIKVKFSCAVALAAIVAFLLCAFTGTASGAENKALILVDQQYAPGVYPPSQDTLANLMGHFDLPYDIKLVDAYTKGDVDRYRVTFYLGSTFDRALPADFLNDVLTTNSRVVWINYNLWKLGWDHRAAFESRFGIRYQQTVPIGSFDKVNFNGITFNRSQDDFAHVDILNGNLAQVRAKVTDGRTSYPYIVQSGNFYYVVDDPMSQVNEDSPYLAFCELLHDMVGIQHATDHRALVRIEDVSPITDPAKIRAIADYLSSQHVPFSIAVIPRFEDPLGAWGPPTPLALTDRVDLVSALHYAVSKGGTIVMHGFTHQYDSVANPYNGATAMDAEFYIVQLDSAGNAVPISPVPEDSSAWVQQRIDSGLAIFNQAGFVRPQIWETPHYLASDLDYQVFSTNFPILYQRFADSFFPFVIDRSIYGSVLLPEDLGYIDPNSTTAQVLIDRASKDLAVRDGFASFFYHPDVDISYLKAVVAGLKAEGYQFVSAGDAVPAPGTCSGAVPPLRLSAQKSYWASYPDYLDGSLSVDYRIADDAAGPGALNVSIAGAVNTAGVTLLPLLPPPVDVAPGSAAGLTLKYKIPVGVVNFRTTIHVTATDACGTHFSYP